MFNDFYIVLIGRIIQVITSVSILRIMTSILPPEEMGKYALITAATTFFSLVLINPVGMYINRYLHQWKNSGVLFSRSIESTLYFGVVALIASITVAFLSVSHSINLAMDKTFLALIVFGNLFFVTLNQTVIPSINMLGKRAHYVILSTLTLWISLGASVILTKQVSLAEYWIAGQIIGSLLGTIIALKPFLSIVGLRNSGGTLFCRSEIRILIAFSIPVSIAVGLNWLQFQSYRFIISELLSLEFLGLFVAGYSVSAGILNAFETTATQYFYPLFYEKINDADSQEISEAWSKYASRLVPLTLLTTIFVCVLAEALSHLLLSRNFWNVSWFIICGAIIEACRVLGNMYGMIAHATLKTRFLVKPQLVGAIMVVVLTPIAVYFFGGYGVGFALILSSLLYLTSMHFSMVKLLEIKRHYYGFVYLLSFIFLEFIIKQLRLVFESAFFADFTITCISGILYLYMFYRIMRRADYNDDSV
ncbi:MAG: hypothetical protein H6Q73_1730 [Firmicutes bacterium]|nr:hypothetical protein [Bacillota bacterium]